MGLQARWHYGFLSAHRPELGYLNRGHTPGLELGFYFQTGASDTNNWTAAYHLPRFGLGYSYIDFSYAQVLGHGHALFGLLDLPLLRYGQNSGCLMDFRIGFGASCLNRYFNARENNHNIAIGSPVNIYIQFALNNHIRLLPHLSLLTGLSMHHYSNGAMRMPNLGLNIFALHGGLAWKLGETKKDPLPRADVRFQPSWEYAAWSAIGWRDVSWPGGRLYPVLNLGLEANRMIGVKSALKTGADVFYNSYANTLLQNEGSAKLLSKAVNNIAVGFHLGYAQIFGPLRMGLVMGIYGHNYLENDGLFYHRLMVRYHFSPHWFANLSLHSHFAVANNFEWGIGYVINTRK